MPTEHDLRATLLALEHEAPDPTRTLAGLDRRRHRRTIRRRTLVTTVVAAVTLAIVAGSLAAPKLFRDPAGGRADAWTFRFAVDQLPGAKIRYNLINTDRESATMYAGSGIAFEITVFHPGAYTPVEATPVAVRGKPGFYNPAGSTPTLAWEYSPDAWAIVYTRTTPEPPADLFDQLLMVASAVHTDHSTALTLPFRVSHLPAGLEADRAGIQTDSTGQVVSIDIWLRSTEKVGRSLRITAMRSSSADPPGAQVVAGTRVAILGSFEVALIPDREPHFNGADLSDIAKSITAVGTLDDPRGWIPAREAIPLR